MTNAIRVVIADDSAFVRQILSSHLESAGQFRIVGTAQDGREAVRLVHELRPDVLTLDVEMPEMSGLEALETVMRETPTPTVMVSGASLRAAEITLRAIETGAVDFVLKYVPGVRLDPEELRLDIISKVKAAASVKVVRSLRGSEPSTRSTNEILTPAVQTSEATFHRNKELKEVPFRRKPNYSSSVSKPPAIVVLGASTGGPVAIRTLLEHLPHDFDATIVIVQHIPAAFSNVLAAQLHGQLPLRASVACAGEVIESRRIYVAPGDQHLLLNSQLEWEFKNGPPISGHCPSIDVTMKSIGQVFSGPVFGVLLTGMGVDGASGLQFLRSRGNTTYAQESASCVVDGMPKAAIEMGAADYVATPEGIANHLANELLREMNLHVSRNHPLATTTPTL